MHSVQNIAHRGASAYAPENTLPSFDLGLAMGADALETDVRATRDGVLVLCHDARVDRVSDGTGALADLTLHELRQMDFGRGFAPRFGGTPLLLAEDFLRRYGPRCSLALEIKADGVGEPLADMVIAAGLATSVVFTSFELRWLEELRRSAPWAAAGFLARNFDDDALHQALALGLRQICPPAPATTAAKVEKAHRLGLTVRAWGVDGDEAQNRALAAGVDGMTTNWPDRLARRLLELGWQRPRRRAG